MFHILDTILNILDVALDTVLDIKILGITRHWLDRVLA